MFGMLLQGRQEGLAQVTLREYITENMELFVGEMCQMQTCDNCSIGNVEACVLRRCGMFATDEELTEEEEKHLCG